MTINELDSILGPLEGGALQRALNFWVDIGVLIPGPDEQYIVMEKADEKALEKALQESPAHREGTQRKSSRFILWYELYILDASDVVEDSMMNQGNEQKEAEQMRVYWQVSREVKLHVRAT